MDMMKYEISMESAEQKFLGQVLAKALQKSFMKTLQSRWVAVPGDHFQQHVSSCKQILKVRADRLLFKSSITLAIIIYASAW